MLIDYSPSTFFPDSDSDPIVSSVVISQYFFKTLSYWSRCREVWAEKKEIVEGERRYAH